MTQLCSSAMDKISACGPSPCHGAHLPASPDQGGTGAVGRWRSYWWAFINIGINTASGRDMDLQLASPCLAEPHPSSFTWSNKSWPPCACHLLGFDGCLS